MAELDHLLDELRGELEAQSWEGTFQEYLDMVIENPRLACHSHARVHDMIQWHGTTPGLYDVPRYALFADRPQMRSALGIGIKGEEPARRREVVGGRLVQWFGFCPRCARDLVEFASTILQGKEAATVERGRLVVR